MISHVMVAHKGNRRSGQGLVFAKVESDEVSEALRPHKSGGRIGRRSASASLERKVREQKRWKVKAEGGQPSLRTQGN